MCITFHGKHHIIKCPRLEQQGIAMLNVIKREESGDIFRYFPQMPLLLYKSDTFRISVLPTQDIDTTQLLFQQDLILV